MHVVATAGHVDHGKSTLVLRLTGTDPDRFAEEKARGLTIDLGFAWTTLASGRELAFIDVPGHVRFLKNMLAGVGAVDACLFVVAATEGWKPQSEEHLRILELLGVSHGLVALTKVDLVDDEWRELVHLELVDHLAGTFLAEAEVIDVDAPSGRGVDDLTAALDRMLATTPTAADRGRPRLWVDRSFAAKGSGTVVTGTLAGGRFGVEDELVLSPGNIRVRVRALQSHQRAWPEVGPGHRVAVNLTGVSHHDVVRGHALVRPGQWAPTSTFDGSLHVLASVGHDVSRRGAYQLYLGSGEYAVNMRVLGADVIGAGRHGLVRLHLPSPLPLLPGDRFVLRESGRGETVGGGEVLDVEPLLAAAKARPDRSVDRVIGERGWIGVDELERLTGERRSSTLGRWITAPGVVEDAAGRLRAAVAEAGRRGLDVAGLDERDRAVLATVTDVVVVDGRARQAGAEATDWDAHPYLAALRAEPFAPPAPDGIERGELRDLVRAGVVVESEGAWFAADAIAEAAHRVAVLLAEAPEGVTVSAVRDALGTSRKHVLPLLAHLDATGVTRRRDDLRIGGPRLPILE
ncbi:MAG: selenocysteine-specific elongation factor [Acidimicrobiaceae bacterium]|nr:selenocysteine-specific elongation factor [Acidimicrobiaceae bacterium]